jgi:hypothetical protein
VSLAIIPPFAEADADEDRELAEIAARWMAAATADTVTVWA